MGMGYKIRAARENSRRILMRDSMEKYLRAKAEGDKRSMDEIKNNPLIQYSTSELKEELRRRKRER